MKKWYFLLLYSLMMACNLEAYSWKLINNTKMPLKVNVDTSLVGTRHKSHKFSGEQGEKHSYKWGGIQAGACFKRLKIYDTNGKKIKTVNLSGILAGDKRTHTAWTGCNNKTLILDKRGDKIIVHLKAIKYRKKK